VLIAARDELEQQIGMAVRVGEISDLVDDQERRVDVVAQPAPQRGIAIECGKVAQQLTRGGKQHGVAVGDGLMGNILRRRSRARRTAPG
jgi:hypothetical protein